MKLQLSQKEETEPAENTKNTVKLGNKIMETSIFTLAMENPYNCCLCAKKSISRSHMKSHARENLNPYAQSYQGTTQRDSKRIIE